MLGGVFFPLLSLYSRSNRFFNNSEIPILNSLTDNHQCSLIESQDADNCSTQQFLLLPFVSPYQNPDPTSNYRYVQDIYEEYSVFTNAGQCDYTRSFEPEATSLNSNTLRNSCPMYNGNTTCCKRLTRQVNNIPLPQESINSYQTTHLATHPYPRCDAIIKYIPCALCSPNRRYMTKQVYYVAGTEDTLGVNYFDLRICHSLAEKIYQECRYVKGIQKGTFNNRWIVDPGMGIEDFKIRLGISEYNIDNETLDQPGVNCWNYPL